jgi:hypothetical protein
MSATGVHLQLYDRAGQLARLIAEPQRLSFSTKLPGGCYTLSFGWQDAFAARFAEYDRRRAVECEVTDDGGEPIWSGRRRRASVGRSESTFDFAGWWDTLGDVVFGFTRDVTAGPIFVDDVLGDVVQQVGIHLAQSTSGIQHNALDLTAGGAGDDLSNLSLRSATEVLAALLAYPDTAGQPWSAAIWADRVLRYFPRGQQATHFCEMADLAPGWQLAVDTTQVYSSVILVYRDANGDEQTAGPYTDQATAEQLGWSACLPKRLPTNVTFSDAALDAIADMLLRLYSRPRQQASGMVLTSATVETAGGRTVPTAALRAGDVLAVVDLPVANAQWAGAVDDLRVFPLGQTSWTGGFLSWTPDYPVATLDSLFSRMGASVSNG